MLETLKGMNVKGVCWTTQTWEEIKQQSLAWWWWRLFGEEEKYKSIFKRKYWKKIVETLFHNYNLYHCVKTNIDDGKIDE